MCIVTCWKGVTVEPVLLLYMIAIFMQYSVFQDLIYRKVCITSYNTSVCEDLYDGNNSKVLDEVQSGSSMWIMTSTVALSVPSIIVANLLGSWGDTYGRKLPLIVPSVGGILSSCMYVWIASDVSGPVWPVVVASAVSGIFGGFVSCIMAVMSYVSCISTATSRTARVSLLEAMTFLGGTVGPFIGSEIFSVLGHSAVFVSIGMCHCVIILYVVLSVPQVSNSQPEDRIRQLCSLSHVKDSLTVCFKPREDHKRQLIMYLLISGFIIMTASAGEIDVSYLYVKDKPLKWDYLTYSYYFGLKYALASGAIIIGSPAFRYLSVSDYAICIAGILSKIAGLFLLGLSTSTTAMFLVPVAAMCSSFCIPAIRSLLSKQVEPVELGKMFAFFASIENLCTLFGSVQFNSLYPVLREIQKGLIFHYAAATQVIPLIIIMWCSLSTKTIGHIPLDSNS